MYKQYQATLVNRKVPKFFARKTAGKPAATKDFKRQESTAFLKLTAVGISAWE